MIDLRVVRNMQAPPELRLCAHLAELLLCHHRDSLHLSGGIRVDKRKELNQ